MSQKKNQLKKSKRLQGSTSTLSDVLMNDEQRERFVFGQEAMDYKGIVNTNKIKNQTVYDIMLIHEHISQPEHEAAFVFIDELAQSGASVASSNLEGLSHAPAYTVGGSMSDKRMSFSDAFRHVTSRCGEESADHLMKVTNNLYDFPAKKKDQVPHCEALSLLVREPLVELSKFYGVDKKRDARDILRSQVGAFRS